MADVIVLKINKGGTFKELQLTNDSYKEPLSNIDHWSISEAGTNLRAVTRTGIPTLSVSYECDETDLKLLIWASKQSKLEVKKWSEESQSEVTWNCAMTDLSPSLKVETPNNRFYKVSFKLKDLEA